MDARLTWSRTHSSTQIENLWDVSEPIVAHIDGNEFFFLFARFQRLSRSEVLVQAQGESGEWFSLWGI